MRHHQVEEFESRLSQLLAKVDHELERQYAMTIPPKAGRPNAGTTCNPQYDGVFSLTAVFSAGLGSIHGAGYTIELRIVSNTTPAPAIREQLQSAIENRIKKELPTYFPMRKLNLVRERNGTLKLIGDLGVRPVDSNQFHQKAKHESTTNP